MRNKKQITSIVLITFSLTGLVIAGIVLLPTIPVFEEEKNDYMKIDEGFVTAKRIDVEFFGKYYIMEINGSVEYIIGKNNPTTYNSIIIGDYVIVYSNSDNKIKIEIE